MLLFLFACAAETACSSAAEWFEPSCTDDTLEAGCYTRCEGDGSTCETGTCTLAAVNPCYDDVCQACGADEWLCL